MLPPIFLRAGSYPELIGEKALRNELESLGKHLGVVKGPDFRAFGCSPAMRRLSLADKLFPRLRVPY